MSPFFIVTTSRRPSRRVRRFCKELLSVIPNSVKVNRGKLSLDDLYLKALELGGKRVILVSVLKGNPGVISFYDVNDGLLKLFPWMIVAGVKFFFEQEGRRNFSANGLAVRFYDVSLERVAASLANIFNCVFFSRDEMVDLSPDTAMLNVRFSLDGVLLSFTDTLNLPIGPIIKIKKFIFGDG